MNGREDMQTSCECSSEVRLEGRELDFLDADVVLEHCDLLVNIEGSELARSDDGESDRRCVFIRGREVHVKWLAWEGIREGIVCGHCISTHEQLGDIGC